MERMLMDVMLENLDKLKSRAAVIVNNIDDMEDLIQDLAEKVLQNNTPASMHERPMAYLTKIMRNIWFDKLKARRREIVVSSEILESGAAIEDVESIAGYNLTHEIIRKEFLNLTPEMQEAFLMVYFDGYSVEETARMFGLESNTLSQRFRRFRQNLQKILKIESISVSAIITTILTMG